MKLSLKIFFSMCITAFISSILVLGIIMNKNYEINVQKENERTIGDFSNIVNSIENDFENYPQIDKHMIIETYNNYYLNNKIQFIYVYGNEVKYSFNHSLAQYISEEILNTNKEIFLSKIVNFEEKYYLFISTSLKNNQEERILCVRDVTYIYETQEEIKNYGLSIITVTTICVAIFSFIISKGLTLQLNDITEGTKKISKGDYKVNLKENNSEFGKLAKAFNKMTGDIRNRTEDLVKLVESKQIFIDNLSHEMNTPLTTIQGYAEFLERANVSSDEKTKYLQYIQQESKRIKDIYKKLLLLSYKKEEDLEITKQEFSTIIEDIRRQLENRAKEKKIELIINNNIEFLLCDKTLVQIAISNLIINAINVSIENSKIIVNCYDNVIEVIDFGIGISKENIEKILEPFYRVDKARSREHGGAGLGLSICKNIMEMHKGNIKIESKLGEGSKFCLIFP